MGPNESHQGIALGVAHRSGLWTIADHPARSPMLHPQAILDAARRAAGAASCPAEVLLFGSYARGDADAGSDLDLMVIEEHVDDKTAEYLKIHRAVGSMGVGVDIVVISREDFERRRQVPGTVPYWAAKEGRRIHDARA